VRLHRALALSAVSASCLTVVSGAAAAPQQTLPIRTVAVEKKTVKQEKQTKQLQALRHLIASQRTLTWQCQASLGTPRTKASVGVWALPASVPYRKWVLTHWKAQKASCEDKQAEVKRQWNWQAFPSWIISLGVCESGGSGGAAPGVPNWYAEGSSSDGTFFSAFNISRSVYDRDAHHMGVRGWNEGPGIPSPYEQAMAVIGHVRLYGDGFTGRCSGIARSSWN